MSGEDEVLCCSADVCFGGVVATERFRHHKAVVAQGVEQAWGGLGGLEQHLAAEEGVAFTKQVVVHWGGAVLKEAGELTLQEEVVEMVGGLERGGSLTNSWYMAPVLFFCRM